MQQVYDGLIDLDAANYWMQGLVGIERLDVGLMQVGSEWKESRKMFGQVATEHFEVLNSMSQIKLFFAVMVRKEQLVKENIFLPIK
jgi:hypothetical protein